MYRKDPSFQQDKVYVDMQGSLLERGRQMTVGLLKMAIFAYCTLGLVSIT